MARKGINFDQVANAARAIKARGQEPTIAAVRVECGNEGSFTTISAHLAKWRTEEADKVETRSLPPEVEDAMMTAMMTVWNVANKKGDDNLNAIRQDFADEKKKILAELDEARAEITTLEKAVKSEEEKAESATEKSARLDRALTAKTSELEATQGLYKQLLGSLKQPGASSVDKKGADTKKARPALTVASPESKQA